MSVLSINECTNFINIFVISYEGIAQTSKPNNFREAKASALHSPDHIMTLRQVELYQLMLKWRNSLFCFWFFFF